MRYFIKKRITLAITLVLFVFSILMATMITAGSIFMLLFRTGLLNFNTAPTPNDRGGGPFVSTFLLLSLCVIMGTAITAFFSRKLLNPIHKVIDATNRIADGDYNVRVDVRGVPELEELSRSFNKMAQELSSVETLRSDFVNDFSHEFKTPIVSIQGFAKLLKSKNLTEVEREEYIDIIVAESNRLITLSTNVLNLSKYEALEIVADKTAYRLDEQIRRAVLLLEPYWVDKDISLNLELDNAVYEGNEDLTLQIWLNLIENAIKFSEPGGSINICLSEQRGVLIFKLQDEGIGIDEEQKEHIFDKFYQADRSHTGAGNGLGLALVKRIVELCNGVIEVDSKKWVGSTFTVTLPGEKE